MGFTRGRPCRYCCIKKRQSVGGTRMNSLMSLQLCNVPTSFFSVHDCTTQFVFRAPVLYQQGRRRYVMNPRDRNRSHRFLLVMDSSISVQSAVVLYKSQITSTISYCSQKVRFSFQNQQQKELRLFSSCVK